MGIEGLSISPEEIRDRSIVSFFSSTYLSLEKQENAYEIQRKNTDKYDNIPQVKIIDSSGKNISFPLIITSPPEIIYSNNMEGKMIFRSNGRSFTVMYTIKPRFPDIIDAFMALKLIDALGNKLSLKSRLLDNGLLVFLPDDSYIVLSNDTLKKVISGANMSMDSGIYTAVFNKSSISFRINPIAVFNKNNFTIYVDGKKIIDNQGTLKLKFQTNIIPLEYLAYSNSGITLRMPGGGDIFFDTKGNILDKQRFSVNIIQAGFMRLYARCGLPFLSKISVGTYEIRVNQQTKTITLIKTPE